MFDPLDAEALGALRAYADRHGRTWKASLRRAWMSGGNEDGTGGILRTLRNTHGPRWLDRFQFPKA